MSPRVDIIENAGKKLGSALVGCLIDQLRMQRDAGLSSQEITSALLTGTGFGAASALKLILTFANPGAQSELYDESVVKLNEVLRDSKAQALVIAAKLSRRAGA